MRQNRATQRHEPRSEARDRTLAVTSIKRRSDRVAFGITISQRRAMCRSNFSARVDQIAYTEMPARVNQSKF